MSTKLGKLSEIKPTRRNSNKHTSKGMKALENSMAQDGYVAPMTATADGEIIDGDARLHVAFDKFGDDALIIHHDGTKPIVMVRDDIPNADDPMARRIHYRANLTAWQNLELDPAVTIEDIKLGFDFEAIDITLPDLEKLLGTSLEADKAAGDTEAQIDKAEELRQKWGVEPGQLWALGDHRLICGDCTDPAVVARVMGGELSRLTLTDPPYDFDTKGGGILGASQKMADIRNLGIDKFNPSTLEQTSKTCVYFCNKSLIPDYIGLAKNWKVSWDLAISHKPWHVANWGGHLSSDLEYIMILGKQSPIPGQSPDVYSKLFSANKDSNDSEVGWAKPVALVEKFLKLYTAQGDIVYEPFSGSGTTIIACENLSRRCRAIEIDAGYVAVALERWATHTGQTPELIE